MQSSRKPWRLILNRIKKAEKPVYQQPKIHKSLYSIPVTSIHEVEKGPSVELTRRRQQYILLSPFENMINLITAHLRLFKVWSPQKHKDGSRIIWRSCAIQLAVALSVEWNRLIVKGG